MAKTANFTLTPQEIEEVAASFDNKPVKVFCVNGVIVEIPVREALKRLPHDVMTLGDQPTMVTVLAAQGKQRQSLQIYLPPAGMSFLIFYGKSNGQVAWPYMQCWNLLPKNAPSNPSLRNLMVKRYLALWPGTLRRQARRG